MISKFIQKTSSEIKLVHQENQKANFIIPCVIVLDNIRSMLNVGSIFRTADAFGLEKIYLCGITGCPPHKEIQKTALGATETVSWQYFNTAQEAVNELQKSGYTIAGLEQTHNSTLLQNYTPAFPLAVVLGNEVTGIHQDVLDLCSHVIEIPQTGIKHSLNVAVAAGVISWHIYIHNRK